MNVEAFKTRVLPLKDKLYRFALKFLRDEDEASDVVQDVFIRVWNKRDIIDQLSNMEAWCMTITRNLSLDRLKSKHSKSTGPLKDGFHVSSGDEETPYHTTERHDTMKRISSFMEALPDKQRQVIHLRDVEGYSYKEISDIMDIDLNQVKVTLFRARKAVKENLLNINAYGIG